MFTSTPSTSPPPPPSSVDAGVGAANIYKFECHDSDGKLLWTEEIRNRVPTAGLNDLLTKYLKGSFYTAAWFVGLIDNAGFSALAAADTAAQINGSNGWIEAVAYSEGTRQTLTLGTASGGSIDNTAATAVFTINAGITVYGGFVISNSTKGGTTGVLYGEGAFAAPQAAVAGNTITVTVTCTAVTL